MEPDVEQLFRMAGAIGVVAVFVVGTLLQLTFGFSEREDW